jgi:hypothetical protein
MSIDIKISHNVREMQKQVAFLQRRHIPFATAKALTEIAITASKKVRRDMTQVLDRPTSYTLNSLRAEKATSDKLVSRVWVRSKRDAGNGNAPESFVLPNVAGGSRKMKRFEKAFIARRIMDVGSYAVAGSGLQLDAHGNIPSSVIRQILSYFGAAQTASGYIANMSLKTKERMAKGTRKKYGVTYFIAGAGLKGGGGGKLFPGIYKRIATGFGYAIKPIIMFVKRQPTYRQRLDMHGIVRNTLDAELAYEFERAMQQAVATSGWKESWKR